MRRIVLVLALLLAPMAPPAPAVAVAQERAEERAGTVPLTAVLRSLDRRFPGRALDAAQGERNGRPVYRVKWLGDDGRVREVLADARTGRLLSVR